MAKSASPTSFASSAIRFRHGEFESECPGYCGAQDTFYVGNMKGVGRIYQQTFIDTYAKVALAKLYDRKTPIPGPAVANPRIRARSTVVLMIVPPALLSCGNSEPLACEQRIFAPAT